MNANIKMLFFLIKNNKVLVCESNLTEFVELLPNDIRELRSYDYFHREFQKSKCFQFKYNKEDTFQKIVYK